MSYAERHVLTVTTDSNGDATAYTPVVTGRVMSIRYVKTDYAVGVDFTITAEASGEGLWTETNRDSSETVAPRMPLHDAVGGGRFYEAADSEPVVDHIVLANDRVEVVVANGGDTKVGTFHIIIG